MRIAVISDMHGNDLAFEAVEADFQKQNVDQIVCLAMPSRVAPSLQRLYNGYAS